MKLITTEVTEKVEAYLQKAGLNTKDSKTLTELIIEQEIIGNQFSPIGELNGKHLRLIRNIGEGKAEKVIDKPSATLIKGNGQLAPIITADYIPEIIAKAKSQGIYAFGIYDSTYNDFFDVFCRRIAAKDCIALIVENGGPQGVVPFGGLTDVTGTNPLAYGIPTNKYPMIFDAATAEHAWGRIAQSKENDEELPPNAYVDKAGVITTDPNVAHAVLPFGGYKGFAINILIDVLSGSLVRGKSGLDQPIDSQRYIGTFIIVIDPASFGDIEEFKQSTTKLADDILAVPARDPKHPVRVPGLRGSKKLEIAQSTGEMEVADEEWNKFLASYRELIG